MTNVKLPRRRAATPWFRFSGITSIAEVICKEAGNVAGREIC
jgi:hypothetical protein